MNSIHICKFLYLYLQESIVQYGWVGIVFVFVFGTAYFNLDGWVTGTNNRKTLPPIGDCGTTIPDRSVPELRDVLGILRLILRSPLYFTSPFVRSQCHWLVLCLNTFFYTQAGGLQ